MPVTVRLSRLFHERLGDELADEIANWFNQVDTSYRGDLRELNELNFARFDAKLEQRVVQLDAKIDRVGAELDAKIDRVAAEFKAYTDQSVARLRAEVLGAIAASQSRILAWMVGLWVTSAIGFAGVVVATLRAR
ncbi:MAG TPA: hypothetical protein VG916_05785 [Gemmatimonadaceae bacterium]|nr:hypothetical protein [Gemmatimonadaceae bacterium]